MPKAALQVVTTTADRKDADALARDILAQRLAACVQVSGPIDSTYWWNDRLETAREWVLTIKTRKDLYKPLEKLLLEKHPYDEPEIVATAIAHISPGYLLWLNEQVQD
jgi:periplasmic divalent cation tolerance protein